ncbi:hypothetical protein ACJJTC_017639 [Scirpophaga incertulas]
MKVASWKLHPVKRKIGRKGAAPRLLHVVAQVPKLQKAKKPSTCSAQPVARKPVPLAVLRGKNNWSCLSDLCKVHKIEYAMAKVMSGGVSIELRRVKLVHSGRGCCGRVLPMPCSHSVGRDVLGMGGQWRARAECSRRGAARRAGGAAVARLAQYSTYRAP